MLGAQSRPEKIFAQTKTLPDYGFTAIEILVAFSIIMILTAISIPSLSQLVRSAEITSTEEKIRKAIATSRGLALSRSEVVTLCPGTIKGCSGDWKHSLIIFVDKNNNTAIDNEETLFESSSLSKNVEVMWRASGGVNYLKFSPSGIARQFGRFHICDKEGRLSLAKAMVINRQGRVRNYKDRDKNGVVEDIDGREPICN